MGRIQTTWTNEGVAQMTTTLNNSYVVFKSVQIGEGVKIAQNSVDVVCTRPLCIPCARSHDPNGIIICVFSDWAGQS